MAAVEDGGTSEALARVERERDAALARMRRLAEAREADAREGLRYLRNVLSVVRVLAQRTADEAESLEMFRAVFDGRLAAFARVQSAGVGDARAGRDLHAIIGDELLGFGIGVGDGVELDGPPVRVTPRAAGLLVLAAHETVSDFAARGARGPVRVEWRMDDGLEIDWIERTGRPAPLPYWVERALAYELKGRVSDDNGDIGFRRRVHLPAACILRD